MENNQTNDNKEKKEKAFDGGEAPKTEKKNEKGKKKRMNGEKKFYLFTAISCAVVLLAIIIVAVIVTNSGASEQVGVRPGISSESSSDGGDNSGDEPVITLPEGMISPVATVTVGNDYGFHQSQTLGWYYVHEGVDFTAAAGTEVLAADDGVVESVYKDDLLLGTEIVISHGDGLKTLYRFVTETDGLTVGKTVKKGDVIATVAEPTGNEYKDGAHLHFEVLENGKSVDPTKYLTLEEK
ncbi:MAG: M23 family metallopeptidase [Clostridia bacterium]|nr:M23 family metallopeptidase [Clostridia bacterium]